MHINDHQSQSCFQHTTASVSFVTLLIKSTNSVNCCRNVVVIEIPFGFWFTGLDDNFRNGQNYKTNQLDGHELPRQIHKLARQGNIQVN